MKTALIYILNLINIKATEENLTFSHVKAFLQAKWRKIISNKALESFLGSDFKEYIGLPKYKQEQIIWRLWKLHFHSQGRECLKTNECPCSCKTSEVVLSDPPCDKECFPEMMSKDDWEFFKTKNRFQVDIKNQKIITYVKK